MRRPLFEKIGSDCSGRSARLRRAGRLLTPLCFLLCGIHLCTPGPAPARPAAVSAQPGAEADKPTLLRELREHMTAGDLTAASEVVRRYRLAFPEEPRMAYNSACISARTGDSRSALSELADAFALGFDDIRLALRDPDLALLAENPDFLELIGSVSAGLRRDAAALRVIAPDGEWSRAVPLAGAVPHRPGSAPEFPAQIRLRFGPTALEIEFSVEGLAEGWRSGDLLLLTLAPLTAPDDFDSDRPYRFAFGRRGETPVGVQSARPRLAIDQVVAELAPEFFSDQATGAEICRIAVPWNLLEPYSPPVDRIWGVNAAFSPRGESRPGAVLTADPAGFAPDAEWARVVPFVLRLGPDSPARIGGDVNSTIVGAEPLRFSLLVWSPVAGKGVLRLGISDEGGKSIISIGDDGLEVELSEGLNILERQTDISAVAYGPIRMTAHMTLPGGDELEWSTNLLRFGENWLPAARRRLDKVEPLERPTVSWRLDLIEKQIAERDPREDPYPMATTVHEVDQFLLNDRDTGSILPPGVRFTAAYESDSGDPRSCELRLPTTWTPGSEYPVVVMLSGEGDFGREVWRELGSRPDADGAVLALPACGVPGADPWSRETINAAITAIEWAGSLFPGGPVRIVAMESAAAAALDIAAAAPGLVDDLYVVAQDNYAPWPDRAADLYAKIRIAAPITFATAGGNLSPSSTIRDAIAISGANMIPVDLPKYPTPAGVADHLARWLGKAD